MAASHELSTRERAVAELLLEGRSNKQIAAALGISIHTVEFHLKNIYAKNQVSSRIEFILKLGNARGGTSGEHLGHSAVARLGEKGNNRDRLDRAETASFKVFVPILGKEVEMKGVWNAIYVLVGGLTALFTGFSWIALFIYYGNLTVHGTRTWALPLILILALLGGSVGLIGKRHNDTLRKVFFSAFLGTSLGLFSILPLMLIVVLPLEKLIVRLGLPDPFGSSIMASDVSNLAGTITMIGLWLVVGIPIGVTLLFVSVRKPERLHDQVVQQS